MDDYPCIESYLFEGWEWNLKVNIKHKRPLKILNTGVNKIAVLTTKFKNTEEDERKIIGFFKIKDLLRIIIKLLLWKIRLRLTIDEAQELNFWNYYKTLTVQNQNGNKADSDI